MSAVLAGKTAVVYGGSGIRVVCLRPGAIPDAVALSGCREVFEGVSRRVGIPVHVMLEEHGHKATLLGRLPRLAEVAEFAALAASDRAGAMTGAVANLTGGSMTD
jgi:3-oxoacyl-[acyl-carrier protein] reductase